MTGCDEKFMSKLSSHALDFNIGIFCTYMVRCNDHLTSKFKVAVQAIVFNYINVHHLS